jgi:hypothetical protein
MSAPVFEVGQPVLVAPSTDDAPWRMMVDVVQEGQITLATHEDEHLPREWHDLTEVHLTCLGRFSVYLIHVPIVRMGATRLVVGEPNAETPMQRRAYARVLMPVPASCVLLDAETNEWVPFAADVRDLGGGGCSFLADETPEAGASVVVSIAIDSLPPVVVVGRVLPREAIPTIGKPMTRLEFALIREADRDRILRFVLLTLAGQRKAQRQAGMTTLQPSP